MNTDEYQALVGRRTTDFNLLFAPGSAWLVEALGAVTMAGQTGDSDCLLWKIWIPPGTLCLQATLYVYWDNLPGKALMRWGQPPVGGLDSVTPENAASVDLANVLALLLTGVEVPVYVPPKAANAKLSNGSMESKVLANTGDWLYIKVLQAPSQKVYQLDARVIADAGIYKEWYGTAVWDAHGNPVPGQVPAPVVESHEDRVLRLLEEAGLAEPLMALAGVHTIEELGQKAVATGVWAGLLRLIK